MCFSSTTCGRNEEPQTKRRRHTQRQVEVFSRSVRTAVLTESRYPFNDAVYVLCDLVVVVVLGFNLKNLIDTAIPISGAIRSLAYNSPCETRINNNIPYTCIGYRASELRGERSESAVSRPFRLDCLGSPGLGAHTHR